MPVTDVSESAALTVSFGIDVSVRVTPHLFLSPTVRLHHVAHDLWLFPYLGVDHRGPLSGTTWMLNIGVTATWR